MNNKELGKIGENYAAKFLITKKYSILEANFNTKYGEIDLIVFDNSRKELIFVEVKTRRYTSYGSIYETISYEKKNRLIKTIMVYLESKNKFINWRLDAIVIKLKVNGELEEINHIKNILE